MRRKKETLARKPHDFEKLRSPTNAASDWCGAGSLLNSNQYINQTRYVRASQISLFQAHK